MKETSSQTIGVNSRKTRQKEKGWGTIDPNLFVDFGEDNWEPLDSTIVLRDINPELAHIIPEIKIPENVKSKILFKLINYLIKYSKLNILISCKF